MNSRERVKRILFHQEADRPAIDLGSTRMTGTSAWSYRALRRALGLDDSGQVRVFDLYQMLAEVEEPVLDTLGCDFVLLPTNHLALGLTYGAWKPWTFWDGQIFQVPADFDPRVCPDGAMESQQVRGGPIIMRMPVGGRYFDLIPGERQDAFEIPHLDESEWVFPEPLTDEFLRAEEAKAKALYESTDRSLVAAGPEGVAAPQGYAGTYHWAMKMMTEPQHCLDYMMRRGEAMAVCFEQFTQAVGDYVDVMIVSGADYGTQQREMFRPALWEQFYMPSWRLVTDAIHGARADVRTWMHCCGSVPNLIPYFIEAGIDILNPVQWTAGGMELTKLKALYGDQLVFWGGAISTQRTFPFGSADDVRREAREVLDIMAPGGGFVVNPIHNVLAEVPVENIVALYETARSYRYASTGG